jgi:hypothetical protein
LEYNSDSEINEKFVRWQSVSSDEAENISNNSSMQHDVWTDSGAKWHIYHLLASLA